MDPDKAGNLCGIPHIAPPVYDEYNDASEAKLKTTMTMTSWDMWCRVCRPASEMLGAAYSVAELSVRTHVCVILRARGTAEIQKWRNSELEVVATVCKLIKSRHNWAILCLFLPNRAPASEKANKWYRQ